MNGFDSELHDIDLKNWHLFKSIKINGPMWKICWDGYTDGYHHHMVHPDEPYDDDIHLYIRPNIFSTLVH